MKIAMAQVIAIGHLPEAIQQDLPLRLVEKRCSGDPRCQLTLQAAELTRHVGVNARLQAHEDLKTLRYGGGVIQHLLRERNPTHPVEHDTPAAVDLLHAPDRGNGHPQGLDGGIDRRFAEYHLL
jgi:hypothetical protein